MKVIRREVAEKAGIRHVLITGSHTHHGPVIELTDAEGLGKGKFDAAVAYSRKLPGLLAGAILDADKRLVPATIRRGDRVGRPSTGTGSRIANPRPPTPMLAVVRFDDLAGKPIAVLVNFAPHPVMTDHEDPQIFGRLSRLPRRTRSRPSFRDEMRLHA